MASLLANFRKTKRGAFAGTAFFERGDDGGQRPPHPRHDLRYILRPLISAGGTSALAQERGPSFLRFLLSA